MLLQFYFALRMNNLRMFAIETGRVPQYYSLLIYAGAGVKQMDGGVTRIEPPYAW